MDADVKLSMEQAQEKWVTKTLVCGALGLAILASATCVGYEYVDKTAEVQKAQLDVQKAAVERDVAQAERDRAMFESMGRTQSK